MCLERKRNERKMVQRLNGNEATGTSRVVIRHVHVHTHEHTHTIPPHPGTEDSPPSQGEQGAVGQGQTAKLRPEPQTSTHISYRENKLLEEIGEHLLITYCMSRVQLVPQACCSLGG